MCATWYTAYRNRLVLFEYLIYLVMSGTTRHDTTPPPSPGRASHLAIPYAQLAACAATRPDNTVSDTNKLIQAFTLLKCIDA